MQKALRDQLRDCPFCGADKTELVRRNKCLSSYQGGFHHQIGCKACGARGPLVNPLIGEPQLSKDLAWLWNGEEVKLEKGN